MRLPKIRKKKTAFVPRGIFQAAAVAGVLPICAVACGGGGELPSVACIGFDGGPCGSDDALPEAADAFTRDVLSVGVANMAFDGGDAFSSDVLPGVALMASDGGDAQGVTDAGSGD